MAFIRRCVARRASRHLFAGSARVAIAEENHDVTGVRPTVREQVTLCRCDCARIEGPLAARIAYSATTAISTGCYHEAGGGVQRGAVGIAIVALQWKDQVSGVTVV